MPYKTQWREVLVNLKSSINMFFNHDTNEQDNLLRAVESFARFVEGNSSQLKNNKSATNLVHAFNTTLAQDTNLQDLLPEDQIERMLNFMKILEETIENVTTEIEKGYSNQNINIGSSSGQINISQKDINSPAQNITINDLLLKIDESNGTPEQKKEAKKILKELLEHPLITSIIGGLSGGIIG